MTPGRPRDPRHDLLRPGHRRDRLRRDERDRLDPAQPGAAQRVDQADPVGDRDGSPRSAARRAGPPRRSRRHSGQLDIGRQATGRSRLDSWRRRRTADLDRRRAEVERLPDRALDVAQVRLRQRPGREQRERRRVDRALGGVQDAGPVLAVERRRVALLRVLIARFSFAGRDPRVVRRLGRGERGQHVPQVLAGERRELQHRRVAEERRAGRRRRSMTCSRCSVGTRSHLFSTMTTAVPARVDALAEPLVLVRDALRRVDHEQRGVGLVDRVRARARTE